MMLAEKIDYDLWKAGAPIYASEEYTAFWSALREIKDDLIKEEARSSWFRDYKTIGERLKIIVNDGEEIIRKTYDRKEEKKGVISNELAGLEEKKEDLDRLTKALNSGKLARRNITKGGLMIKEAYLSLERGDYQRADETLTGASRHIRSAEEILTPYLNRFSNRSLMKRWRGWVEDTIAESRKNGGSAIVVSKIDRSLTIYRDGRLYKTYHVGIGRNGLLDKLYAGDGATPEGRYRIIKKLDESKYYKALLISYPNEEDRKRFLAARKKGLVSSKAGIGGLIEIHGGGKEGVTLGCISLDNRDMDEVFDAIPLGTPIAIVGTTSVRKDILTSKEQSERGERERGRLHPALPVEGATQAPEIEG